MPIVNVRYAFGYSPTSESISLHEEDMTTAGLLSKLSLCSVFTSDNFYIAQNGKRLEIQTTLEENGFYTVIGRLNGGKGGFGSLLRSIGAQIEKTTNKEACRDLSGRRMRDIKNEQSIKEWMAKAKEREEETQKRKQEKRERLRRDFNHKFEDPKYFEQKEISVERMDEALKSGIEKFEQSKASSSGTKRKSTDEKKPVKKLCAMFDDSDISDSDVEDEPEDLEADSTEDKPEDNSEKKDETLPPSEQDAKNDNPLKLNEKEEIETSSSTSQRQQRISTDNEEKKIDEENDQVTKNEGKISEKKLENQEANQSSSTELEKLPVENKVIEDIDLSSYNTVKELEDLGLDTLKFALKSRGLKCGGTLQQRAERLFSVKNLQPHQIDKSLFANSKNSKR